MIPCVIYGLYNHYTTLLWTSKVHQKSLGVNHICCFKGLVFYAILSSIEYVVFTIYLGKKERQACSND